MYGYHMNLMKRMEARHYHCHHCTVTVQLVRNGGDFPRYHAEIRDNGKRVIMLTHIGYFTGIVFKILEWHVCPGELRQTVSV